MRVTIVSLVMAAFLIPAVTARPAMAIETVGSMLPHCEDALDPNATGSRIFQGYCMGVVRAVIELAELNCALGQEPAAVTGGHSTGAAIQAFVNWARANPSDWELSPVMGVMIAVRSTFPCE